MISKLRVDPGRPARVGDRPTDDRAGLRRKADAGRRQPAGTRSETGELGRVRAHIARVDPSSGRG